MGGYRKVSSRIHNKANEDRDPFGGVGALMKRPDQSGWRKSNM